MTEEKAKKQKRAEWLVLNNFGRKDYVMNTPAGVVMRSETPSGDGVALLLIPGISVERMEDGNGCCFELTPGQAEAEMREELLDE